MAQGVLTGKYLPGGQLPAGSRATTSDGADMMEDYLRDDILSRVQQLKPIAADAGLTMAQLAIAWVLQNDNVAAALVGASRPEQVKDNAGASGVRLEPELMDRIDTVLDGVVERDPAKTESPDPRA
jgi:aryl-alcohol dehydrogenase-like predicted oxidoreductase